MNQRLNNREGQQKKLTNKEKAQELLFDALEATGSKRRKLAKEALKLYPDSPEAYTILADLEMNPVKAEELLLKAIEVGEKELGQGFFEENKGHFWGIVSTRPYMRAKYNYALLLQDIEKTKAAIKHYEELLELNPNDNQGVRYDLFTALVEKGLLKKAEELLNRYNEDMSASGSYNRVLIEFLQNGATSRAKQLLQKAKRQNPYVPKYLVGKKAIPLYLPNSYQPGDEAEAIIYADQHLDLWHNNRKLMDWLVASQ
nr:tetratricopeptide repeat protein [Bacillus sp. B15-48]